MVISSEMRPMGIFLRIHMLEHASKNPAENPAESIAKTQRNPLEKPSEKTAANLWKPVKFCENLWKPVKICENLWKPVKTCENLWKPRKTCENLWKPVHGTFGKTQRRAIENPAKSTVKTQRKAHWKPSEEPIGLDGMKYGNRWKLSSAMDTFQRGRFTWYYPAKELGFSSGRWLGYIYLLMHLKTNTRICVYAYAHIHFIHMHIFVHV